MQIMTHEPQFTLLDPNYYLAVVTEAKTVKNNFYDPQKPNEGFPEQVEITFSIQPIGAEEDTPNVFLKKWFSPVLSKKSYLNMFLKALYPTFDYTNPKPEELETNNWLGKEAKVNVTQKEDQKGTMRNRITDILPAKK